MLSIILNGISRITSEIQRSEFLNSKQSSSPVFVYKFKIGKSRDVHIYIPGTSLVKIIFKSYVSVLSYFLKTTKLVCLSRVIFCKEVIYFIICEQNMTIFLHNKAFYSRLFLNFFFLNVGQTLQILKLTFKTL